MLKRLHISNYALIDHLDLEFYEGLNTITGETGAGKSILLGALGLILGQRAELSMIKQGESLCVVEATFDISAYQLESFFEGNDLDYSSLVIVRRQMNDMGKSRAFINDTPVNLALLKAFAEQIIDIHSQHANLLLQAASFQMRVLDSFAGNSVRVQSYRTLYRQWQTLLTRLNALRAEQERRIGELEYTEFQLQEIRFYSLRSGEQEELEEKRNRLAHAEEIAQAMQQGLLALQDAETNVIGQLHALRVSLGRVYEYSSVAEQLAGRLESVRLELQDVARELENELGNSQADPVELQRVEKRLNFIYHLQSKHHCTSISDLLKLADLFEKKLETTQSSEGEIKRLEKQASEYVEQLEVLADELHRERELAAVPLAESVTETLRKLGIEHARFVVQVESVDVLGENGKDRVEFLFSANRQIQELPLTKVASGGEMSRVMLSLKRIIALSTSLPTVIFDEIDAGISGAVAAQMGAILAELSESMQVINITHLPQIAAQGKHHFLVYKTHEGEQTVSRIRLLSEEERATEIAHLLSGTTLTEVALQNARELLRQANA